MGAFPLEFFNFNTDVESFKIIPNFWPVKFFFINIIPFILTFWYLFFIQYFLHNFNLHIFCINNFAWNILLVFITTVFTLLQHFFRIVMPKTVMWCIMHNSHIGIWHWICLSHMYHHVRILSNMDIVFLYLMATWLHSAYLLLEDIWSGSHSA